MNHLKYPNEHNGKTQSLETEQGAERCPGAPESQIRFTDASFQHVAKGLPFKEIETLRDQIDEPLESLGRHLSISRSTLQRRRADRRLTPQESDRVLRFCRLLRHAVGVFGDLDRARQWLKFPQRGLGGAVPLDYASSEIGAREVDDLLGRIEYSVYW